MFGFIYSSFKHINSYFRAKKMYFHQCVLPLPCGRSVYTRLHAPTRAYTILAVHTQGGFKKKLWLHSASNLLLFYGFGQLEYSIAYILWQNVTSQLFLKPPTLWLSKRMRSATRHIGFRQSSGPPKCKRLKLEIFILFVITNYYRNEGQLLKKKWFISA